MHKQFMKIALREAEAALATGNLPVGSIVTLGDKVIGTGRRTAKSLGKLDHGEMLAVQQAFHASPKETEKMVVYTTLEPCMMCFGTILNCRIPKMVYAFPDDYGGATNIPVAKLPVRHQENKFEVVKDVCRAESKIMFRQFFEATDQEFWQNQDNPLVKAALAD